MPFRVFKRDQAASVKAEFPNMKSQERQMIVKARWADLPEGEKTLNVVKARFLEETLCFQ